MRQTVSKWERGLSVPDAEMLVAIGEVLDTPVSTLLGETVPASEPEGLQALSEKLEVLNDQFAGAQESKRRTLHASCIAIAAVTALVLIALAAIGGSYLEWDFSNPEYAVAATLLHGFEWIFVRVTPIVLLAAVAGVSPTAPPGDLPNLPAASNSSISMELPPPDGAERLRLEVLVALDGGEPHLAVQLLHLLDAEVAELVVVAPDEAERLVRPIELEQSQSHPFTHEK